MALEISSVKFRCMDAATIRRLSVVQVTMPEVVDNLERPIDGGLYDPAMGPIDRRATCATCSLSYKDCPGHMGRIELPVPVYNPLLFKDLYRLLRCKCFMCHHLKMRELAPIYVAKLQLLRAGELEKALALNDSGDYGRQSSAEEEVSKAENSTRRERLIKEAAKIHRQRQRQGKRPVKFSQLEKVKRQVMREVLVKASGLTSCEWCGNHADALRKDGTTKIFRVPRKGQERSRIKELESDGSIAPSQEFLHPMDAEKQLLSTWEEDGKLLDLMYPGTGAEGFFLHVLCVPPNRFRPAAMMGGMMKEHQQNVSYGRIIKATRALLAAAPSGGRDSEEEEEERSVAAQLGKILPALVELQTAVDQLFDNDNKGLNAGGGMGIKQQLEKKEGLFRKHMMGKRVNFAARSVISPDPNIATNEIGIPVRFARKLTYPERVTPHNVAMLRRLVENGTEVYPGANFIEDENGRRIDLAKQTREQRASHAQTLLTGSTGGGGVGDGMRKSSKVVFRQLLAGDFLLVNRQPTLHKPGIMAHKARILMHDKVIRMHYANCNTYNADFDGDEMNLHFPQDELARAEALTIALTDQQYLVPTDGSPLRGLIQDHVVSGVHLTKRDTFLTREQFQQLLWTACQGECDAIESISSVIPALLVPRELYTGKQVISALLKLVVGPRPPMHMSGKSKVPANAWGLGKAGCSGASEEGEVIVRGGELVQGVLDKSQFGSVNYSLVHSAFELYGATVAGKLLTVLGRLFTYFLRGHGFTCGLDDLVLTQQADKTRRNLQSKLPEASLLVESKFAGTTPEGGPEALRIGMRKKMMEETWKPELDSMLRSTLSQSSDNVRDACIPAGSYKLFPANCFTLMTISGAKGSKVNHQQITCQLGQQELEGARVPVMVSGKSLPCFAPYCLGFREGGYIADRFLTGVRPPEYFFHCMSGREGLVDTAVKTSRSGYLQRCLIKHLEELRVHYDHTVRAADGSVLQFLYGEDALDVTKTAYMNGESNLEFLASNYRALVDAYQPRLAAQAVDTAKASELLWAAIKKPTKKDPVISKLMPSTHLSCVSEHFAQMVRDFCDKGDPRFFKTEGDTAATGKPAPAHFEALMHLKYLRSLAEPGEPVGVIAGQSVGEPSTQMTLNTFHFAGVGGHNVTLGIPRLRELLMTASTNIKTPLMTLPLRPMLQRTDLTSFLAEHRLSKHEKALSRAGMNLRRLHRATPAELSKAGIKPQAATKLLAKVGRLADEEAVARELGMSIEDGAPSLSKQLANDLQRIYLSSVLETVAVTQRMEWSNEIDGALRVYTITITIAQPEAYRKLYSGTDANIKAALDGPFLAKLNAAIAKELKRKVTGVVRRAGEKAQRSSSTAEHPAAEANGSSRRKKSAEDSDSDDDMEAAKEDAKTARHTRGEKDSHYGEDEEPMEEDLVLPGEEALASSSDSDTDGEPEPRTGRRAGGATAAQLDADQRRWVYVVPVDAKERKLLMAELGESVAKGVVLKQSVDGVISCLEHTNEKTGLVDELNTQGVNLAGIRSYASLIDVDRVDSNDVNAVLQAYGIEAARGCIIRQVRGVFGVYGIDIDPRHLNLIADYMTAEGSLRPFNRMGIDSNASPFLKMSFETCTQFLTQATMDGDCDTLSSPSARIVLGKVVENGTGSFDLLQPVELGNDFLAG